jgi:hypothetical protein
VVRIVTGRLLKVKYKPAGNRLQCVVSCRCLACLLCQVWKSEAVTGGAVAPNGVMVGRLLFLQTYPASGVGLRSGKEVGDLSQIPLAANFKQFDV